MKSKDIPRVMGVVWIATSLLWATLGVAGLMVGFNWLKNIQIGLDENLTIVVESLDSVYALIDETTDVVSSTHRSLETVQHSTHDVGIALADARPLLWKTSKVVTIDVPDALDGVQDSMPSLVETAKSVDETLTWLSDFQFTIPNPFGPDWSYDLGISYDPEVPLNQAMEEMSGNLEGVPEDLRDMKESLNKTDANLVIVSDDLAILAGDLETLNQQIADINPRLESLASNIENVQQSFQAIQEKLPESFKAAQRVIGVILGLLILTQIPFIYMGWLLISGAIKSSQE